MVLISKSYDLFSSQLRFEKWHSVPLRAQVQKLIYLYSGEPEIAGDPLPKQTKFTTASGDSFLEKLKEDGRALLGYTRHYAWLDTTDGQSLLATKQTLLREKQETDDHPYAAKLQEFFP